MQFQAPVPCEPTNDDLAGSPHLTVIYKVSFRLGYPATYSKAQLDFLEEVHRIIEAAKTESMLLRLLGSSSVSRTLPKSLTYAGNARTQLTARDWGLWKTVTINLEKLRNAAQNLVYGQVRVKLIKTGRGRPESIVASSCKRL